MIYYDLKLIFIIFYTMSLAVINSSTNIAQGVLKNIIATSKLNILRIIFENYLCGHFL